MEKDPMQRLSSSLDEHGRYSESRYIELAMLCKHAMDKMANAGKQASDNYFFFQDLYFACWSSVEILRVNERLVRQNYLDQEVIKIWAEKISSLEAEISGYRTIDRLSMAGNLQEWIDKQMNYAKKISEIEKRMKQSNPAQPSNPTP